MKSAWKLTLVQVRGAREGPYGYRFGMLEMSECVEFMLR